MMNIYIASTILSLFVVFGCIPVVVSMLTGEGKYFNCLMAGAIFMLCVAVIIAIGAAVIWSALFVMAY